MNKSSFFLSAFFCASSFLSSTSYCDAPPSHFLTPTITDANAPWFTGPLIAPAAHSIPPHHGDIEPYLYFWSFTGNYDKNWESHSTPNFYRLQLSIPTWVGLNSFMDFTLAPQVMYQFTEGQRSTQFGDLPFGFDFQLLSEQPGTWWPAIKLGLQATAPLGNYNNLNPSKLGTDASGLGSWNPNATLAFGRFFLLPNGRILSPRLVFNYAVPNAVRVKNYNAYGGTKGTGGTVYPGNIFWCDLGLEYNMTQRWVLAFDLFYQHTNKIRFSGNPGEVSPGVLAVMTSPSSESFSVAPALEYNWSSRVGLIGGVWMTVAGRNSSRFISGVLALNVFI